MELNVSAEDVNRLVADAVLKSTIGKVIEEQVTKAVQSLTTSWNNPIEAVVKQEIARITTDVMRSQHAEAIREAVQKKVTEKLTDELIEKLINTAWQSIFNS